MIVKGERIGCSSDFWNNYKQDIKLAADLGEGPACCLLPCAGPMRAPARHHNGSCYGDASHSMNAHSPLDAKFASTRPSLC